MTQMQIFVPTAQGEMRAPTLTERTHSRRTDPPTSRQLPRKLSDQKSKVLGIIQAHGPGTSWELAHKAWNAGNTLGLDNVTEVYYAIERRAADLEVAEYVRVTGIRPCTIKEGGRKYQEWDVWR